MIATASAILLLAVVALPSNSFMSLAFGFQSPKLLQSNRHHHSSSRTALRSTFQQRNQQQFSPKRKLHAPKDKQMHKHEIINKPIGSLDIPQLRSICNLIRHIDEGYVYKSLNILERILLELDAWSIDISRQKQHIAILKPIHIFTVLSAISKDIRDNKQNVKKYKDLYSNRIDQLQNIVLLLKRLVDDEGLVYCDPGCFNEDVLSFATMISADVGRFENKGVDAAISFLDLMEDISSGNGKWDPRLIGAVLNSLALRGRAVEAHVLLESSMGVKMNDTSFNEGLHEHNNFNKRRLDPSQAGSCYNALIRAWSRRGVLIQKQSDAESKAALSKGATILLNHMPNLPGVSITNRTCAAALQGYGTLGLSEDAEELLVNIELMLQSLSCPKLPEGGIYVSKLDTACYNSLLAAQCQGNNISRAEQLFDSMVNQKHITYPKPNGTTVNILPPPADYVSYSTLLNNGYSKNGLADEAESLLKVMRTASLSDSTTPILTTSSYLSVIRALERSSHVDAPSRISSLIDEMERLHHEDKFSIEQRHPPPNRAMYLSALKCMSKLGKGKEAEQLFTNMRDKNWVDAQACTHVLKAWAQTEGDRYEAAIRAEALLNELQVLVEEGQLKPLDVNIYNIVLNCYAKVGLDEKADTLLRKIKPDGISYGLLIKAISKSNKFDAVDLAWDVLHGLGYNSDKLSPLFNKSIEPFNSMLRLLAKRGYASDAEELLLDIDELYYDRKLNLRPNAASYVAVLEALGRCSEEDSATRAEALLTRMDVLSELGGKIQPTLIAYNHLINCYGNAGMSARAEKLFDRLKQKELEDQYSVGSTIKAIINGSKSQENSLSRVSSLIEETKCIDGAENQVILAHRLNLYAKFGMGQEAEKLLRQIETPGIIHYTIVLNAWAKSDAESKRAEILFHEMEEHSELSLDIAAYNSLMLNYSHRGQIQKAEDLFKQILDIPSIQVDRKTFTMLINAYNNALDRPKNAPKRAEELLDKMRELHAAGNNDAEPDDVTYRNVIRCIRGGVLDMTDHERNELKSRLQLEKWPFDEQVN